MLELDITLTRDRFRLQVQQSLDLSGIWAIMGPSGCGKTSLLRCLAGLERQVSGCIRYNGQLWQDSAHGLWVPPEKRGVGYIFQDARLFPHLDVMGNLTFAMNRARPGCRRPALEDVISRLNIAPLLHRGVSQLSGGEKQRVAMARAVLNGPSLLLMDEPLASLDWQARAEILPLFCQLRQHFGIPVLMVSHDREDVARLASQLLLLQEGRVVRQGHCASLLTAMTADAGAALSVLEGQVLRHDDGYGLTEIAVNGQLIRASQVALAPGQRARLVLRANRISIFLQPVVAASLQNSLSGVIEAIAPQGGQHVLLSVSLGKQTVQVLICRRSLVELALVPGQQVHAAFKAVDLEVYQGY